MTINNIIKRVVDAAMQAFVAIAKHRMAQRNAELRDMREHVRHYVHVYRPGLFTMRTYYILRDRPLTDAELDAIFSKKTEPKP